MKKILIIVFFVITTGGLVFSLAKWCRVLVDSPEIYEVISSDGARYTTKKEGSFEFEDSAKFEVEDGSTVILTNGYSYKLLNPESDEIKRWKKEKLLYGLISIGCLFSWGLTLVFFFDMDAWQFYM